MMATMFVQGGVYPQFLDTTAVRYLRKGGTNIICDLQDMPPSKRDVLFKVSFFPFCFARFYCFAMTSEIESEMARLASTFVHPVSSHPYIKNSLFHAWLK